MRMLAQLPENKNKSIIIVFRLLPRHVREEYSIDQVQLYRLIKNMLDTFFSAIRN